MKIALLSVDGYGFPIAYHLQEEGHDVFVGQVRDWPSVHVKVKEKEEARRKRLMFYDGLFDNKWSAERLVSYLLGQPTRRRATDWFVLCDFNWLWPYADKLRKAGYRGLLPHSSDYQLEHDRNATRDLISDIYPGIETGDYEQFKTSKDGIAHLEKNKGKLYVLKGFNAESETIVPGTDDPELNREIIIDALEHDQEHLYEKDGFILEEKIPDVIEFTPEAIAFDGEIRSVNVDVEHKRFGSRNGPMTGCASGVVMWQDLETPLYEKFLAPLQEYMLRPNELTVWDLSVLYSPSREKFYAGEFCPNRMGFDAVFAEICTYSSATDWLEHLINGGTPEREPIGVSLRIFNPDKCDSLFIGDPSDPNVWCYDVYKNEGKLYTTGLGKDVYVLTAESGDLQSAINDLYELEDKIEFDPGYCLQKHDWQDTEWPQNVLHRIQVVADLGLISIESGVTDNAEKEKRSNQTGRDGNRDAEESRTATVEA